MKTEIKVPSAGESITSGIITSWRKKSGDKVNEGDILFDLETEKTTLEVPSPVSGILETLIEAETEVEVGQVVGLVASEAEDEAEISAEPQEQKPVSESGPVPESKVAPQTRQPKKVSEPIARIKVRPKAQTPISTTPEKVAPASVAKAAADDRRTERIPMSFLRKKTAERLVKAQHTAAYLTTFNEIDMQKVVDIRNQYKAEFEQEHGTKIGFMSFFVKACCQALKEYPGVNSMLDEDDIVYQYFYDIGVAISLDEGLMVPVIRDADTLCFAGIEAKIIDLAQRAKKKKILPDELTGGTFTINNGGVFGSMMSTPIPAYPQTAILGMHAIKNRPVVFQDQIVIRPMMYVALSYDHRVIDGRQAIGFLMTVKNYIEEPDKLLLEL
ncbi:MAG: dihydrolipoyllysine-residue succinyltransferase [Planctomycetota bacterium]|jgi:2-oxoglutarate dehydrogenase E2 component (dihydrolipoamide succinyltransferase)